MLIQTVKDVGFKTGLPLRGVCAHLQVPWSSFGRWQQRARTGGTVLRTPGPGKLLAPDVAAIRGEVAQLDHGRRRSAGTAALYQRHCREISRRELAALVAQARSECNQQRREQMQHLRWMRTGVVWSMDTTECEKRSAQGLRIYVQQVEELCSRYKLQPIGGDCPIGEEIAGHLDWLWSKEPAPLLLKRDNGGTMNHPAVDEVLQKHFVLPLNNPLNYAQYNGAMERAQGDLKQTLDQQLQYLHLQRPADVEPYAAATVHRLNHTPRDCLGGKVPCAVYNDPAVRVRFTKTERSTAYEWMIQRRNDIVQSADAPIPMETAWRVAVKQWLVQNKLLTITVNKKVLPNYP